MGPNVVPEDGMVSLHGLQDVPREIEKIQDICTYVLTYPSDSIHHATGLPKWPMEKNGQ